MITSRVENIKYAARKLRLMSVPFPLDKVQPRFDLETIVAQNLELAVAPDASDPVFFLHRDHYQENLDDVVHAILFELVKPVIAHWVDDWYVVYDAA